MTENIVINQKQAAAMRGITTRRLRQLETEGGDPPPRNADGKYPAVEFGEWLKRYFVSPQFEYAKEKARLTHFQATEKELQVKVLEGDLVPAEDVRDLLSQLLLCCRSKLLALPGRAAQSAIDARDVKTIESDIRDLVYESLEEISDGLRQLPHDPKPSN